MKERITIGMDLGDRYHLVVVSDAQGNELKVAKVINTRRGVEKFFQSYPSASVAMEAGTHSPWISRMLKELGCQVYVGNPRKLRLIWDSVDKSDLRDARMLAMVCRLEPKFLCPIKHRNRQAQADLALVKSRDILVRSRTKLINHTRGLVKSVGERLPGCSSGSFAKRCSSLIPEELNTAVEPVLANIAHLSEQIRELDRKIDQLCDQQYPETQRLRQVPGVGPVTALTYVLSLEQPGRFGKSRQVGAYLGLTPRRDQSGASDKQLRITKAGNRYLRQLLVSCAHYIMGPFGPDSDLRRHGMAIAARGGKNAKKRAIVAVARKLSVLLHQLWLSGQAYEPFYNHRVVKAA